MYESSPLPATQYAGPKVLLSTALSGRVCLMRVLDRSLKMEYETLGVVSAGSAVKAIRSG
jgi:hypothetical protein